METGIGPIRPENQRLYTVPVVSLLLVDLPDCSYERLLKFRIAPKADSEHFVP
jgi:hypothetical protein